MHAESKELSKYDFIEESLLSEELSADVSGVSLVEVRTLYERIDSLEYQHLVNLDRLEKYVKQEEIWLTDVKDL